MTHAGYHRRYPVRPILPFKGVRSKCAAIGVAVPAGYVLSADGLQYIWEPPLTGDDEDADHQ